MNNPVIPYLNSLWACLIMEEFVRLGNHNICISPGSRNTPLAMAAALHPKIKSAVHYDERGTAFYALGQAKGTQKASVVVSTSGSAVANFMPAIVEAAMDRVPLVIITADRPPELRDTGANQTIDQVKFFSHYSLWQFDLPCPTLDILPETLLGIIDQAVYRCENVTKGVVHLNCMFREPFLPESLRLTKSGKSISIKQFVQKSNSDLNNEINNKYSYIKKDALIGYTASLASWLHTTTPKTDYLISASCSISNPTEEFESLSQSIGKTANGLLILGNVCSKVSPDILLKLSKKLKWPVFADINSGIRQGYDNQLIVHYYDQLLYDPRQLDSFSPDFILQIGHQIVSRRLLNFLHRSPPEHYIIITDSPDRVDPNHQATKQIVTDISECLKQITAKINNATKSRLPKSINRKSAQIDQLLTKEFDLRKTISEPGIVRHLSNIIPAHTGLFVGSSMPIRYMDMFSAPNKSAIRLSSNRGASGIDGSIATAAGFANMIDKPMTVLIGDLALLHDMNSLQLVKFHRHPFVIIALNNDGGGIFSLLPVSKHFENKKLEHHFSSAHGLKFDKAAAMFGFNYESPSSLNSFVASYTRAIKQSAPMIIEISSDRSKNAEYLAQVESKVKSLHIIGK